MLRKSETRAAIVYAALECAVDGSWETTSLRAVRERAGVSNGSLFHHFPTRQELDAAVVAAALGDHQDALNAELREDAETTVVGVVHRHLQWVQDNATVARLLLYAPPECMRAALAAPALETNRAFFRSISTWLGDHGWRESPALPVVLALWVGPAQEYSRQWLAGPRTSRLIDGAEALGPGAWAALAPLLHAQPDTSLVAEGTP
jgi:AcrR family transcriptional regulator